MHGQDLKQTEQEKTILIVKHEEQREDVKQSQDDEKRTTQLDLKQRDQDNRALISKHGQDREAMKQSHEEETQEEPRKISSAGKDNTVRTTSASNAPPASKHDTAPLTEGNDGDHAQQLTRSDTIDPAHQYEAPIEVESDGSLSDASSDSPSQTWPSPAPYQGKDTAADSNHEQQRTEKAVPNDNGDTYDGSVSQQANTEIPAPLRLAGEEEHSTSNFDDLRSRVARADNTAPTTDTSPTTSADTNTPTTTPSRKGNTAPQTSASKDDCAPSTASTSDGQDQGPRLTRSGTIDPTQQYQSPVDSDCDATNSDSDSAGQDWPSPARHAQTGTEAVVPTQSVNPVQRLQGD
eukprot:gene16245-4940_t